MIEYDGGCRANKRGKIRQIGVTVTPQHRQITRNQSVPTATPVNRFKDFSPKAFAVVEIACDLPSLLGWLHSE